MKKLLLAGLFAATASMSVSATILQFDDSTFNTTPNPSGVLFDGLDLKAGGVGTVIQTGTSFTETGILDVTAFTPFSLQNVPVFKGYEVLMDYTLAGIATNLIAPNQLDVTFNSGSAMLYADSNVDGSIVGATALGSLMLGNGTCTAFTDKSGSCDIRMGFTPVAGFFALNGVDLLTHQQQGAGIWFDFTMTLQNIVGLNFVGTPFQIKHDGNATVSVPEPTSIAILGLGLLGLASARRRKS